jgi:hypothetical protein
MFPIERERPRLNEAWHAASGRVCLVPLRPSHPAADEGGTRGEQFTVTVPPPSGIHVPPG